MVFFTTYKPYSDECGLGGKSFIWALRYNTGGALGALLKGVALLQVSTGSIEQLNLSSAFTQAGGRKSAALEGVPPTAQGLSLVTTPPPVKKVIHMRER
jgi:type IV pilus assembly protein PilY1